MRVTVALIASVAVASSAVAQTPSAPLSVADQAAAFKAAGFKLHGKQWRGCGDDGADASYTPGAIDTVKDLNGDGRLDAVISESSTFCFGMTGTGYSIVSKQADGSWKKIASGPGVPGFLATRGADGWPDLEVGGPGFCFPVLRWNGKEYVLNRHEYEGKPCKAP
jgi:hypothetical protein